jgi:hypothetical protein
MPNQPIKKHSKFPSFNYLLLYSKKKSIKELKSLLKNPHNKKSLSESNILKHSFSPIETPSSERKKLFIILNLKIIF